MEHLTDEQLFHFLFADVLSEEDTDQMRAENAHLAECAACRERRQAMQRLVTELDVVRRSQPSHRQSARYAETFAHVQTQPIWQRALRVVQMHLTLDSRRRPALQGLRSAGDAMRSYRLLYSTDSADVELLVEADGLARSVEGEVLPLTEQVTAPALIELLRITAAPGQLFLTTESSTEGRFRLQDVAPGRYRLSVIPVEGPLLNVEDVTIT